MTAERRVKRRVEFRRPVSIIDTQGERSSVMSCDFSLQGLGFFTQQPFNIGDRVHVTFNAGAGKNVHILKAYGEVVYRMYHSGLFRFGVRFYLN